MEAYNSTILKLDEEFKMGIQNIRGYLMNLSSPYAARCCGEWLQKLRFSSDERELRNILLQRLTTQVQQRKLEYPFDRLPDNGPLYKLYEEGDASSWCTDEYETKSSKETATLLTSEETDATFNQNGGGDQDDKIWQDIPYCKKKPESVNSNNHQVKTLNQPTKTSSNLRPQQFQTEEKLKKCVKQERERPLQNNKGLTEDPGKKRLDELTTYMEEYKFLLTDYKKVVNDNLADLAERLDTAIENNQLQKSDLKNLQSNLQDSWTAKLQTLENELIAEVNKLEIDISTDRTKYETKIEQLKQIILEKDEKIHSLDCKIKQQGISLKEKMEQVRNEISSASKEVDFNYKKKYNIMKRQLSKLEQINKDLIKQHERDIAKTKDYEIKIEAAKLAATDESALEVESKVNELERSYQKILQDFKQKLGKKSSCHHVSCTLEDLDPFK